MDQQSAFEADPRELALMWRAMQRHLRSSLAIILGCVALAALLTLLLPKRYSAEATLSYDPQLSLIKGGGELELTDAQRDAAIDAQLAQVTTTAVAQDVARSVDLSANPDLQREAAGIAAASERRLSRDEALGAALLGHVKARRIGQTPMFTIGFTARGAVPAADIANGFAAATIAATLAQKAALATASERQLAQRVAQLRRQATQADSELAAFRLANHLLETVDSPALDQEVAALRGQLADAHGQAAQAGTRSTMAAVPGAGADSATVVGGGSAGSIDTTSISALTQQRAAAAADLAALLGRYGEKHPDVIAARQKSAELDAQLAAALHGNRSSAAVEASAAGARAQALSGSLRDAERQLAANVGHDARLLDLQNSAMAARLAYQDALKISADQAAQRALLQPDVQEIAPAVPPLQPRWPRWGVDLLIGLVIGLGAAVVVALIRTVWRQNLDTVDDITRWLGADYFAPVPLLTAGRWRRRAGNPAAAVLQQPRSAFATGCASLARAALFVARQHETAGGRVIGLTSALAGEGKTTIAIAMAQLLASSGLNVALVDGDPHGGPALRDMQGATPAAGAGRLAVVAGAGDDLARTIPALRQDYDVVIIDAAPVANDPQGAVPMAAMDALILLARWRATPVTTIREAMRCITAAGGRVSGVALAMVARV